MAAVRDESSERGLSETTTESLSAASDLAFPQVTVIPAVEDLIFFADVGSTAECPVDEDDDVLLVGGLEERNDDCDCDDEVSRISVRSKRKSPRRKVGGLGLGKKVTSLAKGIANRQKSSDSPVCGERGKGNRRGSFDPACESSETSAHSTKHLICTSRLWRLSPCTNTTLGLTAAPSEEFKTSAAVEETTETLAAVEETTESANTSSLNEYTGNVPILCPLSKSKPSGEVKPLDATNSGTEKLCIRVEDTEPDTDQENINRSNNNSKTLTTRNEALDNGTKAKPASLADQELDYGIESPIESPLVNVGEESVASRPLRAKSQQSQPNRAQESSASSTSAPAKEILLRPRIIDLTPSMISSTTISTPTHAHSSNRHRGGRSGAAKAGQNNNKELRNDASWILQDIAVGSKADDYRSPKSRRRGKRTAKTKSEVAPATPEVTADEVVRKNEVGYVSVPLASPSMHKRVLMEMIMHDISGAAVDSNPSSPAHSDTHDEEEDFSEPSRRNASIFSFDDELASYSSSKVMQEVKEELFPSLADAVRSPVRSRPSSLRVRSPESSIFSSLVDQDRIKGETKQKHVSFCETSDIRYYSQREGKVLDAAEYKAYDLASKYVIEGGALSVGKEILFEQDFDENDSSVFSSTDYYYYSGDDHAGPCGAATSFSTEETNQEDFSWAMEDVLLDWRHIMARQKAFAATLKQISGTRLEWLQQGLHHGFQSATVRKKDHQRGEQ